MPILVELFVVMTMGINKARRERQPACIDNVFAINRVKVTNIDNAITFETHGAGVRIAAATVVDHGVNDQYAARVLFLCFTS